MDITQLILDEHAQQRAPHGGEVTQARGRQVYVVVERQSGVDARQLQVLRAKQVRGPREEAPVEAAPQGDVADDVGPA